MTKDRVLAGISLCLGILMFVLTFFTVDPTIRIEGDPGPQFFPYVCASIFILFGIILAMRKSPEEIEKKPFLTKIQWIKLFSLLGVLGIYILLIAFAGFCIGTCILLFVVSSMFAYGKNVSIYKRGIYSILVTVVMYLLFRVALKVYLRVC
ncbi:MAG: tripartite tricarboxylate transporter TctB family protein [Sphaerochaetaceae bacterium]